MSTTGKSVLALAGGVGGAKLASGLAELLSTNLAVLVNTGDDFQHLGFDIAPDLDTVMYTLAGVSNPESGWGVTNETWSFMDQIEKLGGPTWFRLGDRDLATHTIRSERLRHGDKLTEITKDFCDALSIKSKVLPMTDEKVSTIIRSNDRHLTFQEYFVKLNFSAPVSSIDFIGIENARYNPAIDQLLSKRELLAIILCPSNPYLSIDPILKLPGLRRWLKASGAPIIAVSPIVGGKAIKGPAAKIMSELGIDASVTSVARHYQGLIDGIVIDFLDRDFADMITRLGIQVHIAPTVMKSLSDRVDLARRCLAFAETLHSRKV